MNPPDQRTVQRRALCLGAFHMRGEFEQVLQRVERPEVVDFHQELVDKLNEWVHDEGLDPALSPTEQEALSKAPGTWSKQEIFDASWRCEALGVILWALSLFDFLPDFDTPFDSQTTTPPLGLMQPPEGFFERTSLRPRREILAARSVAELWHWRSRMGSLQDRQVIPGGEESILQLVALAATQAHARGLLPEPLGEDFPVLGKPYRDLSAEEYATLTSIAVERHFALNWLCGAAEDGDQTPVEI